MWLCVRNCGASSGKRGEKLVSTAKVNMSTCSDVVMRAGELGGSMGGREQTAKAVAFSIG